MYSTSAIKQLKSELCFSGQVKQQQNAAYKIQCYHGQI